MNSWTQMLVDLPLYVSILLKITLVLGVGWMLHLVLVRCNPRWRVLLWRAVVAGVVLVPVLVPLKYLQVPVTPPPETTEQIVILQPRTHFASEHSMVETSNASPAKSIPILEPPSESIYQPSFFLSVWTRENISAIVLSGWVFITVILMLRLLAGFAGIKKKMGSSLQGPEHLKELLRRVTEDLNCPQKIGLRYSSELEVPFLTGFRKPVIILPERMIGREYAAELPAIFAHEITHVSSRDLFWMLTAKLLSTALWFHPLVWKLGYVHNAACEEVCDAVAADYIGNAESYSGTLARVALEIMGRVPTVGGIPMARSTEIVARLRILKQKIYSGSLARHRIVLSLLVGFAALATLGGLSLVYAENSRNSNPTEIAPTRSGKPEVAACKVAPVVPTVRLDTLPAGWRLDYDDGTRAGGGRAWRSGMAKNLLELRVVPTPANEYDESWTQDRIEFRIFTPQGELMDQISANFQDWEGPWCSYDWDHTILAPDKYRLIYRRGRRDPKSGCTIPLNRVEFPVDLSRPGMYQLKFRPKLETPKTLGPGEYAPTTCTGKIIDTEGNLVVGAKVAAYEMFFDMAGNVNLRPVGAIITKSDGNFLFETTPSVKKNRSMGGYVVAINEGLALGWAEWPLYGTQQVTITLGTPMKLGGMVVDESGAPVPKAEIRAVLFKKKTSEEEKIKWLPGIAPLEWLAAKSDNNGRFQFNDIPSNVSADLLITASGLSTIYTRRPDEIKSGYEGAAFVAGKTDIKITMPAEARIEGKVVDKETGMGIAGATLAVTPHFTGVFFERFLCTSKEDGTFSIGGLRNGEYLIRGCSIQGKVPRLNVTAESGKTASDVIIEWPHVTPGQAPTPSGK